MSRSWLTSLRASGNAPCDTPKCIGRAALPCMSAAGWAWQAMQFTTVWRQRLKVHRQGDMSEPRLGYQQQEALPGRPLQGLPHHDGDTCWPSKIHHAAANNHSVNDSWAAV